MKFLIGWFAGNHVAANLLMALIILAGSVSLPQLTMEVFPVVETNEIVISISYPGAGPHEVEENVTIPIEEALEGVTHIKQMSSRSRRGRSEVTLKLDRSANVQVVMDETQSRVDGILSFPENIEPVRIRQNIKNDDIIDIVVSGDADQKTLALVAKKVKSDLFSLPEISLIDVYGLTPNTISIEVAEFDLRRFGLSMSDIATAIEKSTVDISLGSIRNRSGVLQIRADGRADTSKEFANITVLMQANGVRVKLGDIAVIKDGVSESFFLFRSKGKPSIILEILLSPGQDVLKLTSAVKGYLVNVHKDIPQGITVTTWRDDSVEFFQRLEMLVSNSLSGLILVFVLLVFFLRLDLALWVTFGIVIAFSGTFAVMNLFGFSINQISLFGFLLVLGIVVDDAIIIGEGIHSSQQTGTVGLKGAVEGASSLSLPVILAVVTTVLAVIPLLFFESETGRLSRDIAVVVAAALAFSLVECLLILPCHLSSSTPFTINHRWYRRFVIFQSKISQSLIDFSVLRYLPFLEKCLRAKYATTTLFMSVLIVFVTAYNLGFVRSSFNPEIPSNIIRFKVELTELAPKGSTEKVHGRMIKAITEIETEYERRTGLARNIIFPNYSSRIYGSNIYMQLEMSSEAMAILSAEAIMSEWQKRVGDIDEAVEITLKNSRYTGHRGGDLSFYIAAANQQDLEKSADLVKEEMRKIEGVTQIFDNRHRQQRELQLTLKSQAEYYGITLGSLSEQVRLGFYGRIVQRIPRNGETIDVHVRFPLADRQNLQALREMKIKTPDGGEIPFSLVAEMSFVTVPSFPERINGRKIIKIQARINRGKVSPYQAFQYLEKGIFEDLAIKMPEFSVIAAGEIEEQSIFFGELFFYLSLVLISIYCLIAVGLRSYVEPLVILTAVPFGFVGAVIGHLLLSLPVSLYSFLGLFAAAGVVVNDNLVLVDRIKSLKARGVHYSRAIPDAARQRFRAIILTSVTTFVGLIPIMLETSYQALFIIPMVVSLTFGVLFASLVTLILVPCLYQIKETAEAFLYPSASVN
ncbi:MAG: multidrug efflux pump subunit AcrB [Gammaproteobacteria bacterium]